MSGAERKVYYWNPYGTRDAPAAARSAVAAHRGWTLVEVGHTLQQDGFQCAPWSHIGLQLFVEYFRAGKFDGFAKCFAEHPQLRPVNLASGERAKARAKAINDGFVANLRDEMRQALREADADTAMPFRPTEADVTTTHFSSPERRRVQAQGSSSHDAYDLSPTT